MLTPTEMSPPWTAPDWQALLTAPIVWTEIFNDTMRDGWIAKLGHLTGRISWSGTVLVYGTTGDSHHWDVGADVIEAPRVVGMEGWAKAQVTAMLRAIVARMIIQGV